MARYIGPVCRLCRREGEKLFLKGERCFSSKCAVERRESAPGQHGKGRQSYSDYKVRLREKQKAKRVFGCLEQQFRKYYEAASTVKNTTTGTALLQLLETRLDSVVFRLGFAVSRSAARQLVRHGHVAVNGKVVDIPSYSVGVGTAIEVTEGLKKNVTVQGALTAAQSRVVPEWLTLDKDAVKGSLKTLPTREQMVQGINEQFIVELYSR